MNILNLEVAPELELEISDCKGVESGQSLDPGPELHWLLG